MRVSCITSSYPASPSDVAGRFVREHCKVLHEAGIDVTVYTWRRGGRYDAEPWEVVEVGWVPSRLSLFAGNGAPGALEAAPWRIAEGPIALAALVTDALRRPAPDLWIGHWLVPGGVAARICGRLTDTPSLVVGHSAGVHLAARLPRPVRAALTGAVEGPLTVPTRALAERLGVKADVLPMGFEGTAGIGPRSEDVLCYGRFVPVKGFDLVPGALEGLGLSVHFAGGGPLRAALTSQCTRRDVEATFHGWVGPLDKPAIFGRADVALFPSRVLPNGRHEGWPVSVMEVSAAGVVPLVADWPGAAEMVVDPDVQVVCDWTPEAWREALLRWKSLEPDKREALRRRSEALARKFTWDSLGPEWVRVVDNASGL